MSDVERIRVLSIDDHPLVREGIAALINNQAGMQLAAQGSTGKEAIQLFRALLRVERQATSSRACRPRPCWRLFVKCIAVRKQFPPK